MEGVSDDSVPVESRKTTQTISKETPTVPLAVEFGRLDVLDSGKSAVKVLDLQDSDSTRSKSLLH